MAKIPMKDVLVLLPMLRPTQFSLDFLADEIFEGYTQDEKWNGFACPYFSFEQAQHLVVAWRSQGWKALYDPDADSFNFHVETASGAKEDESYQSSEIEGKRFYPIGTFNWIWDEVGGS